MTALRSEIERQLYIQTGTNQIERISTMLLGSGGAKTRLRILHGKVIRGQPVFSPLSFVVIDVHLIDFMRLVSIMINLKSQKNRVSAINYYGFFALASCLVLQEYKSSGALLGF